MIAPLHQWQLHDFDHLHLHANPYPLLLPEASEGFTLEFWFQVNNVEPRQVILWGEIDQRRFEIVIQDQQIRLEWDRQTVASHPISDAGWHRLACSVNMQNGVVHFLLDQTSASLTISPLASTLKELHIGGYTDPAGGHFNHTFGRNYSGHLNQFKVYAQALSANDLLVDTPPREGTSPSPEFSVQASTWSAPTNITFSVDNAQTQNTYYWDFGDGTRGYGAHVNHVYDYAGDYSIQLTQLSAWHDVKQIEKMIALQGEQNPFSFIPVFSLAQEGYACYRIPAIVRALNGDLIAFAEGRLESCSDSTATIHAVCKRSTDDGKTWLPLQVMGQIPDFAVMNISPVVDEVYHTGKIVVVFRATSHSEWDIANGVGLSRAMCVESDDHGQTWSEPRDITEHIHRPYQPEYASQFPAAGKPENEALDWRIQTPTLGHSIQLQRGEKRGRFVFAGTITQGQTSVFNSQNYIFWSDDLGKTWHIGGVIPRLGLNESTLVERLDGSLLINTRAYTHEKADGYRAITEVFWGNDDQIIVGETYADQTLIDPAVQAGLLRYSWPNEHPASGYMLFTNPAHPLSRVNLTIRLSDDEGKTWKYSKVITRDAASYSDIVRTQTGDIGVLFERGNSGGIVFVKFPLSVITG